MNTFGEGSNEPTREPGALFSAITQTDNLVDGLESVIGRLEDRLEPILEASRDRAKLSEDATAEDPNQGQLSRRVGVSNYRLDVLIHRIQELTSRVEL